MADSEDGPNKELCNYCKKVVSKKYIKCIKCGKVYHNSCSSRISCCGINLMDQNFALTKNSADEVSDEKNELITMTSLNNKLKTEIHSLKEENINLKQHILQLEEKVRNMQEKHEDPQAQGKINEKQDQSQQIKHIKKLISQQVESTFNIISHDLNLIKSRLDKLEDLKYENNAQKVKEIKEIKKGAIKSNSKIFQIENQSKEIKPVIPKQNSQSINTELETRQRQIMSEIINLEPTTSMNRSVLQNNNTDSKNDWNDLMKQDVHDEKFIYPKNKRMYKNKTFIGQNQNATKIKAVDPLNWIFISRLEPDTTIENVKSYLDDFDIKISQCFKLSTYSKEIAAFKIAVRQSDYETVFSGNIWPEKTIIRPYDPILGRKNFQKPPPVSLKK